MPCSVFKLELSPNEAMILRQLRELGNQVSMRCMVENCLYASLHTFIHPRVKQTTLWHSKICKIWACDDIFLGYNEKYAYARVKHCLRTLADIGTQICVSLYL